MFFKSDLLRASRALLAVMSFWDQIILHDPSPLKSCRHANDYKSVVWLMITFFFAVGRSYLLFKFFRDSTSVVANPVWPVSQFFPLVHFLFTIAANRGANWGARLRRLTVREWFLVWNKRDPKTLSRGLLFYSLQLYYRLLSRGRGAFHNPIS